MSSCCRVATVCSAESALICFGGLHGGLCDVQSATRILIHTNSVRCKYFNAFYSALCCVFPLGAMATRYFVFVLLGLTSISRVWYRRLGVGVC